MANPDHIPLLFAPRLGVLVQAPRSVAGDKLVEVTAPDRLLLQRETLIGAEVINPYRRGDVLESGAI